MRTWLVVVLLLAACNEKTKKAKESVEGAVEKVDKVMDKDDKADVDSHLTHAKAEVAAGRDPAEDCSWVERQTGTAASLTELRAFCDWDAPLARATAAVVRAEKAKAEQPEAPTLTECQSDDWPAMKAKLDAKTSTDPRWPDLEARWAKVCPDQK
jgi:hypothetical protein